MIYRIFKKSFVLIGVVTMLLLNSCYYDNAEDLYPNPPACDTTNVTFSVDVFPVINASCTSCHSGSAPGGNVSLSNYDEIVASAVNGGLLGTIMHDANWSPMPKNGTKLDDCTIKKLEIWVANGTPNN